MISLCTQIKDRNSFLEQALPTWLETSCDEVVIFDWPYKERAWDVVKKYDDPRIKVYENENRGIEYNKCAAKNACIRVCNGDLVLYIDGDVLIKEDFLPYVVDLSSDIFMHGFSVFFDKSLNGTMLIHKDQFLDINGYNEGFDGWGHEDNDFIQRLLEKGYTRMPFVSFDFFEHIKHSDNLRTFFYREKNTLKSSLNNEMISKAHVWSKEDDHMKFSVRIYPQDIVDVI